MLKKFIPFVIGLIMLLSVSIAGAASKNIEFSWNQDNPTSPMIKEWKIVQSNTPGGPYVQAFTIPFDGTVKPEYTSGDQSLIVQDNAITTLYFVCYAVGVNGQQSGYSNEVKLDVDFRIPGIPILFKGIIKTP
jgi:hypothetical protein